MAGNDDDDSFVEDAWEDVQRVGEEVLDDVQRAGSGLGPAALLAAAAVVAALLFGYASFVSADASDNWQQALRTEIKRSAAMAEDIRYVYAGEAPLTFAGATVAVLAEEHRALARQVSPASRPRLLAEARTNELLFETYEAGSPILADDQYALDGGAYDLARRLADIRAENPELVALNPDALQAEGDRLSQKATTAIGLAAFAPVAFLLGSLAQVFSRRRVLFLWAGWVVLAITAVAAVALQLEV